MLSFCRLLCILLRLQVGQRNGGRGAELNASLFQPSLWSVVPAPATAAATANGEGQFLMRDVIERKLE